MSGLINADVDDNMIFPTAKARNTDQPKWHFGQNIQDYITSSHIMMHGKDYIITSATPKIKTLYNTDLGVHKYCANASI